MYIDGIVRVPTTVAYCVFLLKKMYSARKTQAHKLHGKVLCHVTEACIVSVKLKSTSACCICPSLENKLVKYCIGIVLVQLWITSSTVLVKLWSASVLSFSQAVEYERVEF